MFEALTGLLAAFGAGAFLSLISVVNPPATVPMYLALAQGLDERARQRMARRACLYCFYILLASLLVGGVVLDLFGVSYGALRVAGGITVGILGHGLMYDKGPMQSRDGAVRPAADPTFFPLAMPGITGPGTIAVVVGISTEIRELHGWSHQLLAYAITVVAMIVVCLVEWLLLRNAPRVSRRLGPLGIEVMTRLSGFLLICVGVQFIASGIRTLVEGH
ncbi:MAG: MarC family NAAT transporter [Burkholderiales bacterium]|nr:MarC family NAAT transporter [Burkholderiales bacterium]MDE1926897.1 MarC family NAAT transporter [Burkholderiales bacterium]MDE2157516.1 MarC family NAAT transporter [Burkholderiales bacterium]MDE2501722.1 MarC family NAAT transporter [Burkholderiales bacterium]